MSRLRNILWLSYIMGIVCLFIYPTTTMVISANEGVQPTNANQQGAGQVTTTGAYNELVIYDGELKASPVRLALGQWGTGVVEETDEEQYEKRANSLRLSLYSLVEGGCFIFGKPIALPAAQDSLYLVMWVKFAGAAGRERMPLTPTPMGIPGLMPGIEGGEFARQQLGAGGGMIPGMPWGIPGMPPGMPGQGMLGRPGAPGEITTNIGILRVVLELDKGWAEINYALPFEALRADPQGWIRMPIPFGFAHGLPLQPGMKLLRMFIGGDGEDEIYIGRMLLVQDEKPLYGRVKSNWVSQLDFDVSRDINKLRKLPRLFQGTAGSQAEFWVEADEGASLIEALWDLDKSDGVDWSNPDAVGLRARKVFPKPGTYFITVMIRDVFGLKQPFIVQHKVKVK